MAKHHKKIKHIIVKKAKGGYITEVHHHPPKVEPGKSPGYYPGADYEPETHVHPDLDAVHDHLDDMAGHMTVKPEDEPEAPKKGKSRFRRMAKELDE